MQGEDAKRRPCGGVVRPRERHRPPPVSVSLTEDPSGRAQPVLMIQAFALA
jgi:hypothetical protein